MSVHDAALVNLDLPALSERLGLACRELGLTVTTAESCTGGGVASAITAVSGSSEWFETGYVTYSDAAKIRLLGVPQALLGRHGAVSREVVEAMVAGACRESGSGLGVAISGIAGPSGGTPDKPVGSVWLAWGDAESQHSASYHFPGDRQAVRDQAVREALVMLIAHLAPGEA